MEISAPVPLFTAEEFYDRFGEGNDELAAGGVVPGQPAEPICGAVHACLLAALGEWADRTRFGQAYSRAGFILARGPDTVLGPEVALVSEARSSANPPPARGFWEIAPDLAVEIVSPDDSAAEINEKVRDYLDAGVGLVWVVYPRTRQVHACRPEEGVGIVLADGVLEGGNVVPGFRLPLAELWP
jgi:Uma2 family endonuclease